MADPACMNGTNEHDWYPWAWNDKQKKYRRECSIMGCPTEYFVECLRPTSKITTVSKGFSTHLHFWSRWFAYEESETGRFYYHVCTKRGCKGKEEVEDLVQDGGLTDAV